MKETSLDFKNYLMVACKYAYLEYEFGIDSPAALFYLNQEAINHLSECWLSYVSIPDAANFIAQMVKKDE